MTFVEPRFDAVFARVVRALEAYLDDLAFVGGVASALYRQHPSAARAALQTVLTMDVDLATGGALSHEDRELIADLLPSAGLDAERILATVPPLTRFVERGVADPIEVEFIVPLVGARDLSALELQPSLVAEPLRYVQLLITDPWSVEWCAVKGLEPLRDCPPGCIPHPCGYVLQKALIRSRRSGTRAAERRRKDSYYIYEVAVLFRDRLTSFGEWMDANRDAFPAKWFRDGLRGLERTFLSRDAPGAFEAASEYTAATGTTSVVTSTRARESVQRLVDAIHAYAP